MDISCLTYHFISVFRASASPVCKVQGVVLHVSPLKTGKMGNTASSMVKLAMVLQLCDLLGLIAGGSIE